MTLPWYDNTTVVVMTVTWYDIRTVIVMTLSWYDNSTVNQMRSPYFLRPRARWTEQLRTFVMKVMNQVLQLDRSSH